jgi:hypothetical protein
MLTTLQTDDPDTVKHLGMQTTCPRSTILNGSPEMPKLEKSLRVSQLQEITGCRENILQVSGAG